MLAEAAKALGEPELEVLREMVRLAQNTRRSMESRRELAAGLCAAMEELWTASPEEDPLAEADEPLDSKEAAEASLWADTRIQANRARLLADCVTASEAGEMTNRSRQAVEKHRRERHLVALRVGREWRYPKWQFDIDGPRGLVPGLEEIVSNLHMSPFGVALWLTTPRSELDEESPIAALRKRKTAQVVRLAEEQGYLP